MIGSFSIEADELYKDNQRMKKIIDQLNDYQSLL